MNKNINIVIDEDLYNKIREVALKRPGNDISISSILTDGGRKELALINSKGINEMLNMKALNKSKEKLINIAIEFADIMPNATPSQLVALGKKAKRFQVAYKSKL